MEKRPVKLRSDLIISRSTTAGRVAVVKDPSAHRFFRFHQVELFLAQQMDGATPLDEIRRRAEQRFDAKVPGPTLDEFVRKLHGLGLLEDGQDRAAPARAPRRFRGNALYLRWRAFDPDRLLDRMVGKVQWLFTPSFVFLAAALIALAAGVTVVHYGTIGRQMPQLYRLDFFVLAWGVLLSVITLHEFAHALTCKHFGGHVHELGFMLIFLQPAMYCNVSDAWLFPERSRRLWVTFAGAFFELFLWALATLVWRLTDPTTSLNTLALIVMLTSGIKTLFNLNPLIKLDGYYLLSDWLDVPNLNRRAMAYVSSRFGTLFGMRDMAAEPPSPRERRVLLIYGILALTFSFTFLGWIVARLGALLTARYQATGFFLIAGIAATLFRGPLIRTVTAPIRWIRSEPGARRRRRWFKAGIGAALLAAILLLAEMELRIGAPFTMQPLRRAEVRAQVEAIIDAILVSQDETVEPGQVIARLSDQGYRADLKKVEAQIAATQANWRMLQNGPRTEEVDVARRKVETARMRKEHAARQYDTARRVHTERLVKARATVAKARSQLDAARSELDHVQKLITENAGSAKEYDDAVSTAAVREKELDEARAELGVVSADDLAGFRDAAAVADRELAEAESQLALLVAGTRTELIEGAEAELARLAAQRDDLAQRIDLLNVRTPVGGVVITPKLEDKVGELVGRGDLIASVHDLTRITAEILVPEKEISDVHVGLPVVLKVRAFPGNRFEGRVESIAPVVTDPEDPLAARTILVTAELDNADSLLKPEMTGHAKILCGKRRILDVVARRFVRYLRVEFWSWW